MCWLLYRKYSFRAKLGYQANTSKQCILKSEIRKCTKTTKHPYWKVKIGLFYTMVVYACVSISECMLFVCISVCMLFVCMSCLSVYLFVCCMSVYLLVCCMSVYPLVCCLSVYLCVCLYVCISVCMFLCLHICLYVVCLYICVYVSMVGNESKVCLELPCFPMKSQTRQYLILVLVLHTQHIY